MVDISVIVVSYNTSYLLLEMMERLSVSMVGCTWECIFVDNASKDDSVKMIQENFPHCRLIVNSENVGFGRANNHGLSYATGRFVLLLNTDAFVAPDTIQKTLSYMVDNPRTGVLGVRLEGSDGKLQPCARYFPTPLNQFMRRAGFDRWFKHVRMVDDMAWDHASVRRCDWVVGCYYLVRKELIDQIGLFDPRYFLYFEEVDHCFAAKKAGWDVVFFPHTTVVHLGGESAKSSGAITKSGRQLSALQVESELLYFRKNHGLGGLLLDVLLSVAVDALVTCKRLIKPASGAESVAGWPHAKLLLTLFVRTRGGSRNTR